VLFTTSFPIISSFFIVSTWRVPQSLSLSASRTYEILDFYHPILSVQNRGKLLHVKKKLMPKEGVEKRTGA
jgi:hypothetical protein